MNWFYRITVLAIVLVGVQVAHADEGGISAAVAQALEGALQAQAANTDQNRVRPLSTTSTCNNSLYITNANGAVAARQSNGCTAYGNQKFPRVVVRSAVQDLNWPLVFSADGFDMFRTTTAVTSVSGGVLYVMVHYDAGNMSSEVTFFNERVF